MIHSPLLSAITTTKIAFCISLCTIHFWAKHLGMNSAILPIGKREGECVRSWRKKRVLKTRCLVFSSLLLLYMLPMGRAMRFPVLFHPHHSPGELSPAQPHTISTWVCWNADEPRGHGTFLLLHTVLTTIYLGCSRWLWWPRQAHARDDGNLGRTTCAARWKGLGMTSVKFIILPQKVHDALASFWILVEPCSVELDEEETSGRGEQRKDEQMRETLWCEERGKVFHFSNRRSSCSLWVVIKISHHSCLHKEHTTPKSLVAGLGLTLLSCSSHLRYSWMDTTTTEGVIFIC